jgi:two-component system chemotaxis response regulator CheB
MSSFRIVVVDDSALFRTMLRNVILEIPNCEMVASVGDGATAVEKIAELNPDMVTLDLEMPDMNGIAVLRELKRRRVDTKVVMISRFTTAGAQVTTDALIEGAFDFIVKPSGKNPAENKAALRLAVEERIQALRCAGDEVRVESSVPESPTASSLPARYDAILIGCSTGGPDALARIIPDLPGDLSIPVFVVQHMPEGFTASLAARLNEASSLEVLEAEEGMRVRGGQVVLARGGSHLQIARRTPQHVVLHLSDDPHEHRCRPAIDFTLRSAVTAFGGNLLVVILTGMGRDGTEGCRLVRSCGGRILAQHADGCTVYGMPKAVVTAGLAHEVIQLPRIAAVIERTVRNRST